MRYRMLQNICKVIQTSAHKLEKVWGKLEIITRKFDKKQESLWENFPTKFEKVC